MAVTLRDIAESLGVSVQSVSIALNKPPGSGRISRELRERIVVTARKMGYQPNRIARALVHGRSRFMGLLMLAQAALPYSEALRGVSEEAADENYGVLLCSGHGDDSARQQLETFAAHQVEGVISVASSRVGTAEDVLARKPRGVPLISINREIKAPGVFSIVMDYHSAMREATEHLIRLGHRRIAYLDVPCQQQQSSMKYVPLQSSTDRREGYLAAMQAAGLTPTIRSLHMANAEQRVPAAAEMAHELLCTRQPPTAFCAVTDWEAVGVLRACNSLQLDVPKEVAIFGSDNRDSGQLVTPAISTIQPAFYEAGRLAVQYLRRTKQDTEAFPEGVIRLPCRLIYRESTPAPPSEGVNGSVIVANGHKNV